MATITISGIDGTAVPLTPQVIGTMKCAVAKVALSGNYTNEGDALTPAAFGLTKILAFFAEPVVASDGETAVIAAYDRTNSKLLLFESGGSGAAMAEKTDAEAVPTGASFNVLVFGY